MQPNADGTFVWPDGIKPLVVPRKQRPPEVDAWNITVQRQLSDTVSVEIAYVGNYGRHVFAGDNPDENLNQVALEGFLDGVPSNQRRPFFAGGITPNVLGVGGNYGWTQTVQGYPNEAHNWYKALQTKFTRRFSKGWSAQVNYTLQRATNYDDEWWIYDPDLNKGPAGFDRTHNFTTAMIYELPFGRDKRYGNDWNGVTEALLGGWQLNTNVFILSGTPFNITYRDAGQDRDTGSGDLNARPDLIGDTEGPQTPGRMVQRHPHRIARQRLRAAGPRHVRQPRSQPGEGPGLLAGRRLVLQELLDRPGSRFEVRIEAANILNHVNLANPDGQIGVPGNDNPNAGRITDTAGNYTPRNFQFGFRYIF